MRIKSLKGHVIMQEGDTNLTCSCDFTYKYFLKTPVENCRTPLRIF